MTMIPRRQYPQSAGALDLRSEVAGMKTPDLALQVAWLMDLPHGMLHLAAPRLAVAIAELNDRAAAVLGVRG